MKSVHGLMGISLNVILLKGISLMKVSFCLKSTPRPYEEALNQAKAELAQQIASRNKANTDYKRFKTLFDQGAVSREELDTKNN